MHIRGARELGLLIRDRRRRLSLTQAELAERIGASRHWVMGMEAGKSTAEVGLVLAALAALDLVCDLRPREMLTGSPAPGAQTEASKAAPDSTTSEPGWPDLARILSRTRASGRRRD
jgi:HTH-type transcriptional regulator/antitoxin HipB